MPKERAGESGPEREVALAEEIGDLRGREIRIQHEPGGVADQGEMTGRFVLGAQGGRPPVLPHDGSMERLTVATVERHQGLALVGDPDGGHGVTRLGQSVPHFGQRGLDGLPYLDRVVFDPARPGEVLGDLPIGHIDHPGPLVDHQSADAGGAGVDGHQFAHANDATHPENQGLRRPVGGPGAQTIASGP